MKRRQFLQTIGAGGATALATGVLGAQAQAQTRAQIPQAQAQAPSATGGGLTVQFLGHSSFLFSGSGQRLLVNPYRSIGCTAGSKLPPVAADTVLISSRLLDEGYIEGVPGDPRILFDPGIYQLGPVQLQGIRTPHDRLGGRRFGTNVAWRWSQGGLTVLHLGGAAAPIAIEQKILMGTPDVVCIPVGGGPKAYTPEEAKQAIGILNPKIVIPTQYRTAAADTKSCELAAVEQFLGLMGGVPVRRGGSSLTLRSGDLPKQGFVIQVMG
jgi:L-ascorbate metabolism protein UlaG (beta-lactamase superfamily)